MKTVTILGKNAPILETREHQIHVRIPPYPNLASGVKQAEITLDGEEGPIAKAPFLLVILPEIESMDPVSGRSGSLVNLETSADSGEVDIYFGANKAAVVSRNKGQFDGERPGDR